MKGAIPAMSDERRAKLKVLAVHGLTASGVVFGLLAMLAVAEQRWADAFVWLGIAFLVDGIDGPLARHVQTSKVLPRFDGERLDLIIDYLTYTVIPAYIIARAPLVPERFAILTGAVICLASLYHFVDKGSKTEDGYFVGFPAIWNIVVLYFFVFDLDRQLALLVIFVLAVSTFIPVKWVHPVRVKRLRPVTLLMMFLWFAAAIWAIAGDFQPNMAVRAVFLATLVYGMWLGMSRSLHQKEE